jgi:ADP-dependent phosphofructokinase/glucokinase
MNWKEKYEQCKERLINNIHKSPAVVTGFNANIDAVRYVDDELMQKVKTNRSARKYVRSMEDLGRGIRESISLGEANEWELKNEKIYEEILRLGYDEVRMGGQAGIVTNLLARLGVKVRVLLPLLAEEQAKHFMNRNVHAPVIKYGKLFIERPREAFDERAEARINCIFEFKKGFMKAPRPNRFILSYRPREHKPLLNERIVLRSKQVFEGARRAFFSGYQLLDSENDFRKANSQIDFMKNFAPQTKFHLEFTNVESARKRKRVMKIAKSFHSIGCNDVELELMSGTDQIFDGMKRLLKRTVAERVHVHTLHNHFCIVRKDYEVPAEKVRDSVMMGAVVCAAKAGLGVVHSKKDVLKAESSVSREGKKYLKTIDCENGIMEMQNFSVIIIPNLITRKVKSTVGLGDSVSSTSFVTETI